MVHPYRTREHRTLKKKGLRLAPLDAGDGRHVSTAP